MISIFYTTPAGRGGKRRGVKFTLPTDRCQGEKEKEKGKNGGELLAILSHYHSPTGGAKGKGVPGGTIYIPFSASAGGGKEKKDRWGGNPILFLLFLCPQERP